MPFIPKDSVLSTGDKKRIAIIGPPGSGKTTSLLTFPNLVLFDRDKNAPPGVVTIPAWNSDWADSICKRSYPDVPNFRDACKKWIRENHAKFEPEQTFAIDSWSFLQDAHDLQTHAEDDMMPVNPKTGKRDGFWFWGQKLRYCKEICDYLKSMKCTVVVTLHETVDRNEEGQITGKIKPVQDGSFKDQILGVFNNVWRMRGNIPRGNASGVAARNPDGTKKEVERYFYWQLLGDSVVDLKVDNILGLYCRKNGIDKIEIKYQDGVLTGGYQEIQKIYDLATANVVEAKNNINKTKTNEDQTK